MASQWYRLTIATRIFAVALWCSLPVSSARPARATDWPGVVVVQNDPGGEVSSHLKWYQRLAASGLPVRVRGFCNSACTFMFMEDLKPQNICVEDDVTFGFHDASDIKTGKVDLKVTRWLVALYHRPVREWIKENGPLTKDVITMSGATAVKLGLVHPCP